MASLLGNPLSKVTLWSHQLGCVILAAGLIAVMGAGCERSEPVQDHVEINDPSGQWSTATPAGYEIDPRSAPHVVNSNAYDGSVRFALVLSDDPESTRRPPDIMVRVVPHDPGLSVNAQINDLLLMVREFDSDAEVVNTTLGSLDLKQLDDSSGMMSVRHYIYDDGKYTLIATVPMEPNEEQRFAVEALIRNFAASR